MKKYLLVTVFIVIMLTAIFFVFKESMDSQGSFSNKNFSIGKKTARINIYLVGLKNSEISSLFSKEYLRLNDDLIKSNKISANSFFLQAGSNDFVNLLESIQDKENSIIVFSPDVFLIDSSKEKLFESKITSIMFSADKSAICISNKLDPYVWNFGLPIEAYLENYLSYLNQIYSKLGKELKFMLVHNQNDSINKHVEYTKLLIDELGFKYIGKLSVDDRIEDTYTSLRRIFDYNPDIILFLSTRRGCANFLPSISKLNLTYDMAVSFIEGCQDYDFIKSLSHSRGIIYPAQYISNGDKPLSSNTEYSAELVSSFISKLLDKDLDKMPINQALKNLDGTQVKTSSGLVMLDYATRSLIQPVHVGKVEEKGLSHLVYLGDVSLPAREICN